MERFIYLFACLFIFSVTGMLSGSGTWLQWPQGVEELWTRMVEFYSGGQAALFLTSLAPTVYPKETKH